VALHLCRQWITGESISSPIVAFFIVAEPLTVFTTLVSAILGVYAILRFVVDPFKVSFSFNLVLAGMALAK
jgi:hypothetical protein